MSDTKVPGKPTAAEIAGIKEHFKRHDSDGDGTIDSAEFNHMLRRMNVLLAPSDEQRLFKAMDLDGSGKIEVCEFIDHFHTILALERRAEEKQMEQLKAKTSFTPDEIRAMYANFKKIACSQNDDGLIDKMEFRSMMVDSQLDGDRNTVFCDALFRMFDRDQSGAIDFSEFVGALAVYHGKTTGPQATDDKAKFLFSLYDVDRDGAITKSDLKTILTDCLGANEVIVTPAEVDRLVNATFAKYQGPSGGSIDFPTYRTIASKKG
jgi:serine/threonine-protein phosphatase 2B regulatory subunit